MVEFDIVAHVTWFARFSEELTCDVIISIVTHDIHCMTTNRVDTGHDAIQASFRRTDAKCPHHLLSFHNFKRLFQSFHCEEAKRKRHFTLAIRNYNIFINIISQTQKSLNLLLSACHLVKERTKSIFKTDVPILNKSARLKNINLRLLVASSTASSRYIQSHYRMS